MAGSDNNEYFYVYKIKRMMNILLKLLVGIKKIL
jgi:hypothetical protein